MLSLASLEMLVNEYSYYGAFFPVQGDNERAGSLGVYRGGYVDCAAARRVVRVREIIDA
jgi:hypothetical protein